MSTPVAPSEAEQARAEQNESPAHLSTRRVGWVILALALGGFGIGTTEFVAMGLLPNIAADLGVTEPVAGHLISAYALGVVVGAPVIAVLAARVSRRTLLIALMIAFTLGNALSIAATTYSSLMAARFVAGLPHGAYFGVAALVAAHLAGPGKRAIAVGKVMMGLSVANVLGVPAATWLGQALGWRSAMALVVVIGVLTVASLWWVLPDLRGMKLTSPTTELGGLRSSQIWLTLLVGTVGFGGFFAFYTYLNTALTSLGGLSESAVPIALMLFGAGMVTGNYVGGRLADSLGDRAIAIGMAAAAVTLVLFAALVSTGWPAVIVAFFVGCAGSTAIPGLQTRLMDVAHDAQTIAAALNHSALNVANAIGAWVGGLVIAQGFGYRAPSIVGAGFAVAGVVVLGVAVVAARRSGEAPKQREEPIPVGR
ncbi:MAG: MFS transporter [Gordonia sp.]|nr:MFS transporter [Gordonia sp. (in: high G+C Gram-positive bacteria)]